MKLSLNIQLTLSIVLGTMLVSNLGSAIAEIPETSQTDLLLLNTDELKPEASDPDEPDNLREAGDPYDSDNPPNEADNSDKPKRPRRPVYPSINIP